MRKTRLGLALGALGLVAIVIFIFVSSQSSRPAEAHTTHTVNIGDDWFSNSMTNDCVSPCTTTISLGDEIGLRNPE